MGAPEPLFLLEDARNLKTALEGELDEQGGRVDAIVTSPPYSDLKEYGGGDQIGHQEYERFLSDLKEVLSQCYDLATENATLWLITDTFRREGRVVHIPSHLADELEDLTEPQDSCPGCSTSFSLRRDRGSGHLYCLECDHREDAISDSWRLKETIVWDKKKTLPWTQKGQFRNVHEHIYFFSKGDAYRFDLDAVRDADPDGFKKWWVQYPERYNPEGRAPSSIWSFPIPQQGSWGPKESFHPSPFPPKLVQRILRLVTEPGDTVLDPFAGAGTTLAVAHAMGRKGIGLDINPEYRQAFEEFAMGEMADRVREEEERMRYEKRSLRRKIWSLRIHKFAFESADYLQKKVTGGESTAELNTIFALVDGDELATAGSIPPSSEFYFVFSEGSDLIEDEELPQSLSALEAALRGPETGGYYSLRGTVEYRALGELLKSLRPKEDGLGGFSSFHVYVGSCHHRRAHNLALSDWMALAGTKRWAAARQNDRPPLFSTLRLDVRDPMRKNPRQPDLGPLSDKEQLTTDTFLSSDERS